MVLQGVVVTSVAAEDYCRNQSKEKYIVACPPRYPRHNRRKWEKYTNVQPYRLTANAGKKQKASSSNEEIPQLKASSSNDEMPPLTYMDF